MLFDISILENIDFSNRSNQIFLIIFLVLAVIVLFIVALILIEFARMFKRLVIRIFNIDVKKPQFIKKEEMEQAALEGGHLHETGQTEREDRPRPAGMEFSSGTKSKEQEIEQKNVVEARKERDQKDIEQQLAELKTESEGGTLESKMPSRTENEDPEEREVKIPRAKKLEGAETQKNDIPVPSKSSGQVQLHTARMQQKSVLKRKAQAIGGAIHVKEESGSPLATESNTGSLKQIGQKQEYSQSSEEAPPHERPAFVEDVFAPNSKQKAIAQEAQKGGDVSIFSGKSEISRTSLRQKLRKDPGVWKAQRASGLTLSPVERSKLEKQIFSQALGRNISKADLKTGIKKLNLKRMASKDIAEKGKLRKEINFFKKIGGIK